MQVFDANRCKLGEGPLWHPTRRELFWFDILSKRLRTASRTWAFDEHVSAAGWVDDRRLLIASESQLGVFDIETGDTEPLVALEADRSETRSNDGRADPYGGFWIGTMGKAAEPGLGAIYRYYRGALRKLHDKITISNAISFSPDGRWAYFADTAQQQIMRQPLSETDGWPSGPEEVFVDLRADGLNPDGAVVDAEGRLWNAQWGASRVACYGADGGFIRAIPVPAAQASCPAFGGPGLSTLFVTTAADQDDAEGAGMTYASDIGVTGQQEHRVIL